jgi:hypothetical protein
MTRGWFGALIACAALWLAAIPLARADPAPAPPRQVLVLLRIPPEHAGPAASYGAGYDESAGRAARRRIAGQLARSHGLTLVDDWPMPLLGLDCFIMAVPEGRSPAEEASRLSRDSGVAWSEPVSLFRAQGVEPIHTDPLFRVQPAARQWRLAALHEMATGRNIRVAVIDSQIEADHPDLLGQVETSRDFVGGGPASGEAHGTGVAGVIAARADNGVGIVGVAPGVRLLALRACWPATSGTETDCDSLRLAEALHFAIEHGARVINLSLSGPVDPLLARLIDVALERGVTVVGAVDPALPGGGFPASHPGVVAVSDESTAGVTGVVFTAPGHDVPTTQPNGKWFLVNGGSYSAAHVSGLFALMREREPRARTAAWLVTRRPGAGGAIDACASLIQASGPCACACAKVASGPSPRS